MKTLLIYDIENDRLRLKVADACLDYGLQRIQFSAFFGEISANRTEELLMRIRRLAGDLQCRVDLFPICDSDLKRRKSLLLHRGPGSNPGGGRKSKLAEGEEP